MQPKNCYEVYYNDKMVFVGTQLERYGMRGAYRCTMKDADKLTIEPNEPDTCVFFMVSEKIDKHENGYCIWQLGASSIKLLSTDNE